ncbi:dienelactone hydrolase family protein [soil metagenome]
MAKTISVATANGEMPARWAEPDGPARGGVLVVQEAFGLTDHIRDLCDRLAAAGWSAIAPALFHSQGAPTFAYDDFDHILPVMKELTAEGITADVEAALDHLAGLGIASAHTAVVGFCMGGTVALFTGTRRPLGAAVSFYGGGVIEGRFGLPSLVDLAPALKTPWLGLYGDLDHGILPVQVEALREAAHTAAVATQVVRYDDADHGFNNDARPAVFHEEHAADAWQRMLDWLAEHAGTG